MKFGKVLDKMKEKAEAKAKEIKEKREERKKLEAEQKARIEAQIQEFENILDKFDMEHLEKYCAEILGMSPHEFEKDPEGNKREIKPNRLTFEKFIVEQFEKGNTKLNHLKDFALRKKLVAPSFFGLDSDEVGDSREFEMLINSIHRYFQPEKITNEEHLQAQLSIFLKAKFPDKKIEREVKTNKGDLLDILVDDKYVFELKVPKNRTHLRNLSAQIEEYVEEYPNLCVVIADISNVELKPSDEPVESNLTQNINEYVDKYKTKFGVQSLVFNIERRK